MTVETAWAALVGFAHLNTTPSIPSVTPDVHLQAAKAMRDHLDRECTRSVCAVCSCYCRSVDVTDFAPNDLAGLHLLDASRERSERHPRDALTTVDHDGVTYCLQPAACTFSVDGVVLEHISVCKDCSTSLGNSSVPKASLVCFDTGNYCVASVCHVRTDRYVPCC